MVDMASRGGSRTVAFERVALDPVFAGLAFLLVVMGVILVSSASVEISAREHGHPLYLAFKHLAFLCIALIAGVVATLTPLSLMQKMGPLFVAASAILLVAVLIPGVGREVNGSVRWIPLGPFSLQGSEFVKVFVVLYAASTLARHAEEVASHIRHAGKLLLILAVLVALLLEQPDYGSAVVIMVPVVGLVFLAGAPLRHFVPLVAVCVAACVTFAIVQPYRLTRLTTFANPWEHAFGSGYQLTQALIAFGRGEWFGLGLGNSIQKLFYLPEAHTDFLFSIVAEELGIIGAGLVILLFAALVIRGLAIGNAARLQELQFHAYLAYGLSLVIGIQASINLGVNLGILPTKGLTLPFMSYGGNSLIVSCMMVALILRIDYETRQFQTSNVKRGKRNG